MLSRQISQILIVCTKEIIHFQQQQQRALFAWPYKHIQYCKSYVQESKLQHRALKMNDSSMVRPASSDFWKAPLLGLTKREWANTFY